MSPSKLENSEFDRIWREPSTVLRRRGVSQAAIDAYMNQQLFDATQVASNVVTFRQQELRDLQAHYEAERRRNRRICVAVVVLCAFFAIVLMGADGGIFWWIYMQSRTWSSCVNDMEFVSGNQCEEVTTCCLSSHDL